MTIKELTALFAAAAEATEFEWTTMENLRRGDVVWGERAPVRALLGPWVFDGKHLVGADGVMDGPAIGYGWKFRKSVLRSAPPPATQIVDLFEALKESLSKIPKQ